MTVLIPDLYKIEAFHTTETSVSAKIHINRSHDIFTGHFPGNPVMPGVCMIQIIKELLEKALDKELFMVTSSNIKFMALVNPEENPELDIQLDYTEDADGYRLKSTAKIGDTVALKFTGHYKIASV